MLSAKIVDGANQIHAVLQRLLLAQQPAPTPHQATQARPKGRIEPFDVGSVGDALALRLLEQVADLLPCALHQATQHAACRLQRVTFHDLHETDPAEGASAVPGSASRGG